jgi:hypothetical protein
VGWRLAAYLASIAVVLFVSAGLVGLASRRMHRTVRDHSWQLVAVSPIRTGGWLLPRVHLEADTGAGPVIVRPLLCSWFDKRYLPHVWIAGLDAADPDAAVVAVVGGADGRGSVYRRLTRVALASCVEHAAWNRRPRSAIKRDCSCNEAWMASRSAAGSAIR